MSDAPVLSAMNLIGDLATAGDFEKKHTPHIEVEQIDGTVRITVTVGHYVAHPNQSDHFIQWIELQVDGNPIARFDLSPVAVMPSVSAVLALDAGTTVRAVSYCNLYGLWAAETIV